jgi:hypothetical protein
MCVSGMGESSLDDPGDLCGRGIDGREELGPGPSLLGGLFYMAPNIYTILSAPLGH